MRKTEGFHILDVQSDAIREEKAKNKVGLQNVARKKLADISNQPQNQRLLIQEKSQSIERTTKEYISQLQKENMDLVTILAQRNKIIEHNGNELARLREHLSKMQEQNQQLALSHSEMLVELNSGKDRLKMLQHELGCKTGLLKARKLGLERRARKTLMGDTDSESGEEMEFSKEDIDDEKHHGTTRNSQSNGECEQVETKDRTKNKRPSRRRQSAPFKAAEVNHAEDSFETNDTRVSASHLPEDNVTEQESASVSSLVKHKGTIDGSGPENEPHQFGRSGLHRPLRAAAKKVQSYKEVSVNAKMRRPQ